MAKTKKSIWKIKENLAKWLSRIGIHEADIDFSKAEIEKKNDNWNTINHEQAILKYVYQNQDFILTCDRHKTFTENLNLIEILVHSRVLGIERGIETVEQSFAGYTALPDYTGGIDYFAGCQDEEERKVRYKRLCKKMHPDVGGNQKEFQDMKEQYENEGED